MDENTKQYIVNLLNTLINKTKDNQIIWGKTSRSYQYVLKMNTGAFIIGANKGMMINSLDIDGIFFKILNEDGIEIESVNSYKNFWDVSSEDMYFKDTIPNLLKDLYKVVSDADTLELSSLKKLLHELDSFSQPSL